MTVGTLLRRGVRWLLRTWWRSVRPSSGAVLPDAGPARPAHETGRAPHPHERWVPTTPPSGPWADRAPTSAGAWPRRGTMVVLGAWAAAVAVRVRRDVRHWA